MDPFDQGVMNLSKCLFVESIKQNICQRRNVLGAASKRSSVIIRRTQQQTRLTRKVKKEGKEGRHRQETIRENFGRLHSLCLLFNEDKDM